MLVLSRTFIILRVCRCGLLGYRTVSPCLRNSAACARGGPELPGMERADVHGMRHRFRYQHFGEEQDEDARAFVPGHEAWTCQSGDDDACRAHDSRPVGS